MCERRPSKRPRQEGKRVSPVLASGGGTAVRLTVSTTFGPACQLPERSKSLIDQESSARGYGQEGHPGSVRGIKGVLSPTRGVRLPSSISQPSLRVDRIFTTSPPAATVWGSAARPWYDQW